MSPRTCHGIRTPADAIVPRPLDGNVVEMSIPCLPLPGRSWVVLWPRVRSGRNMLEESCDLRSLVRSQWIAGLRWASLIHSWRSRCWSIRAQHLWGWFAGVRSKLPLGNEEHWSSLTCPRHGPRYGRKPHCPVHFLRKAPTRSTSGLLVRQQDIGMVRPHEFHWHARV